MKAVSSIEDFVEKPVLTTALTEEEYQDILTKATSVNLDVEDFLKSSDYIISYSEYLFLLSKYYLASLHHAILWCVHERISVPPYD